MSFLEHFDTFNNDSPVAATNLLFEWLKDDERRPELLKELAANRPVLVFQSRATSDEPVKMMDNDSSGYSAGPLPGASLTSGMYGTVLASEPPPKMPEPKLAYLITGREHIDRALTHLSNEPYSEIGDGDFVLGLDGDLHHAHRYILENTLQSSGMPELPEIVTKSLQAHAGANVEEFLREVHMVGWLAARHTMVRPRNLEQFDLAQDVAEQGALRFVAGYFGFPDTEHVLMLESMRLAMNAMIYQMFSRHFVTEPAAIFRGKQGMAALSTLVGQLLNEAAEKNVRHRLSKAVFGTEQRDIEEIRNFGERLTELDLEEPFAKAAKGLAEASKHNPEWGFVAADEIELVIALGPARNIIRENEGNLFREEGNLYLLMNELVDEREERDDNLVPRKFSLVDGELKPVGASDTIIVRKTMIERLAEEKPPQHGIDIATSIVGSIAGLVGNITAATCITMNELLKNPDEMNKAKSAAKLPASPDSDTLAAAAEGAKALCKFVDEAMRMHPPAMVIPRRVQDDNKFVVHGAEAIPPGADVIIPLGSATRDDPGIDDPDIFRPDRPENPHGVATYVFGHPSVDNQSHRCLGEFITTPLVSHVVRQLLALDGLATTIDSDSLEPIGLQKRWGYICDSFPVTHNRGAILKQRPLNVVMKVRNPVTEHAEALKLIIHHGAPLIEALLDRSKIVHFARFLFLNNDSELALLTSYDGDFETYIRFFSEAAGPVFDKIFEHIEDAPPSPVRKNPTAFVEHIRRYDVPAVGDYFYSAKPMEKIDEN